ncbi:MAG: chalcone isomerase family protein [Rhodocyclaceae bacterium]|nr:chalcone isomerase family protein [Rhodocyclaceae bacterium]
MSSSSPLSRARRSLLLALLGWPLAGYATTAFPPGLRRWGRGEYRYFGFLVYEATLWAADDPLRPPLALRLDYKRSIAGRDIAEASIQAMRPLVSAAAPLADWEKFMLGIFPDVRDGDHILGFWQGDAVSFHQGERLIGRVQDAAFARAFFGIWLDEKTREPALRAALLRRSA